MQTAPLLRLRRRAVTAAAIRRLVLEESRRANVGHIGSALSVAEILAVLYGGVLTAVGESEPDRDVFILSKGHAALALYAALHLAGVITRSDLATYCTDGSLLGVHPEHELRGVDFSTGSLGHGLSFAAGAALGARIAASGSRTFVLISDAELNEGLVWEAAMFAGHHRLGQLVAILDDNGQQAMGRTDDIIRLRPVRPKFEAFGWTVREVDGHDESALRQAVEPDPSGPVIVVAHTTAGAGVSYMEGRVEWHYLPMDEAQYRQAMAELDGR